MDGSRGTLSLQASQPPLVWTQMLRPSNDSTSPRCEWNITVPGGCSHIGSPSWSSQHPWGELFCH